MTAGPFFVDGEKREWVPGGRRLDADVRRVLFEGLPWMDKDDAALWLEDRIRAAHRDCEHAVLEVLAR